MSAPLVPPRALTLPSPFAGQGLPPPPAPTPPFSPPQVKACYSHAIAPAHPETGRPAGSGGKVLGRLLNSAVMAGKFVRSETEIAKGAVSISSAAVELAVMKAPEDLGMTLAEVSISRSRYRAPPSPCV